MPRNMTLDIYDATGTIYNATQLNLDFNAMVVLQKCRTRNQRQLITTGIFMYQDLPQDIRVNNTTPYQPTGSKSPLIIH